MAYIQMCGIVIREVQVGEADKIVHLLTDRAGIVSASAKGAMRVKSKLVSATGLLTYSSFSLYEGKAMYIIEDAKVLNQFWNLRKDVVDLSTAVYFLELIRRLSPDEPDLSGHLRLLLNILHFLDAKKRDRLLLKALFELRLLAMSGYMPDLVGCCRCGGYECAGGMLFSPQNGNLLCRDCAQPGDGGRYVPLSPGLLAAMRHIIYSDFSALFNFRVEPETGAALARLAEQYLLCQTEGGFQALDFLKSL